MTGNAFQLVEQAVKDGVVPGAALGVLRAGESAEVACWGLAQRVPTEEPLTLDTVFDLASLTKVLFTVPEVLRVVEDGLADLDDPISRFLPEIGWLRPTDLSAVTLRQLLTHTAGLPAHAPLYTWGVSPATLKARLLQEPWPLGEHVYSDIGYMLLGLIVERLRGEALSARPLSPGLTFAPDARLAASTEFCPWRGQVIRGEVHDENASALGGAAGHAGLFGTLAGVLKVAESLLDGTLLSRAALTELRRPQTDTRALGWERRYAGWSGGSLCSASTIGHTGFTGTGAWIDFERGFAWVLLTNSVHPSRHTRVPLNPLRRSVGNALAASWEDR
ncbi:serine hydrolase domain-containing protein [Deinococcus ruber]|uniref:Esterase n=1 Tax=Deinococcus ruber TaxID=1848197 RepID=A0A918C9Z5_9DEIO|nr:serine hydrolase domain-containing protein [Deinococcus ruber]GGR13950.1 esterase [Deinococcus ruber]